MILEVSNDIKVYNPSLNVVKYCQNNLILDNPDYLNALRLGRYTGNLEKKMKLYVKDGDCLVLPFGCLEDIWYLSSGSEFKLGFHKFHGNSMKGNIDLYDYQKIALQELIKGKNGILEAPCGSGKTNIGLQLIKELGGKALWLTHTKKLLTQSKERCESYFAGDFGVISEGSVNIGKDITFATVQTMRKISPTIYKDAFDIVIVDECHHCVGSPTKVMQFYQILSNCNCRYKYGLSATLNRSDNLISTVYSIIGKKLYTINKKEVGDKIIKAIHTPVYISLEYNKMNYLDFDGTINYNGLINCLSFDERRNKIIVEKVLEMNKEGKKQLVLCHRVNQVERLFDMIKTHCTCSKVTGSVNQKKRVYDTEVIIATYALAKEGLDIPSLDVLHLATPQKNSSTTEQSVGRIERNREGKMTPICFDYVDETVDYCKVCFYTRRRILNKSKKN